MNGRHWVCKLKCLTIDMQCIWRTCKFTVIYFMVWSLLGLWFCLCNIRIKTSGIIHWIWIPWKAMVMQLQGYASPLMEEIWQQVSKHFRLSKIYVILSLVYCLVMVILSSNNPHGNAHILPLLSLFYFLNFHSCKICLHDSIYLCMLFK